MFSGKIFQKNASEKLIQEPNHFKFEDLFKEDVHKDIREIPNNSTQNELLSNSSKSTFHDPGQQNNFHSMNKNNLNLFNEENKKDDEDEINALMLASTSLTTVRVKTNRKQKQLREMESTVELLAPDPSSVIEDKAFGVAQAYFIKLKERLEENEGELYEQVLQILDSFDHHTSTATELYKKFSILLSAHPDLVLEFLLFLLPNQALECGKFIEYLMLTKMSDFLRKMEKQYAKSPHIVRKFYGSLSTLSQQENVTLEEVRSAIIPLFKGNSVLVDSFNQILPNENTPNSLLESSFEIVPLRHDPFSEPIELIPTPDPLPDAYGGESCLCYCHSIVPLDKYRTRSRHCIPCGTKFIRGKVFVETGKGIRCASVMFNGKLPKCHMKRLANRASKTASTYSATSNMRPNVWQQLPVMRLRYNMFNIAEREARDLGQESEEELAKREEEKRAEEEAARRAAEDSARYAAEALEATKRAEEASKRAEKAAAREAEKRAAREAEAAREAIKQEIPETGETVIEAVRQAAAARHAELEAAKQAELAASGQSLISEIKVQVQGHSITEAVMTIRSAELTSNFISCQDDKIPIKITTPSYPKNKKDSIVISYSNDQTKFSNQNIEKNNVVLDMPQLELGIPEDNKDCNSLSNLNISPKKDDLNEKGKNNSSEIEHNNGKINLCKSESPIQKSIKVKTVERLNESVKNDEKQNYSSLGNSSKNENPKDKTCTSSKYQSNSLTPPGKSKNQTIKGALEFDKITDNNNITPKEKEHKNNKINSKEIFQKICYSFNSQNDDNLVSKNDSNSKNNSDLLENLKEKTNLKENPESIKKEFSEDDFAVSFDFSEIELIPCKIPINRPLIKESTNLKSESQQEDFVISSGGSSGSEEEPDSESFEFQPKKARLELSDSEDEQDAGDISPGQGWTRQEDKIILEMFQQEGSSEETLIKIANRISTRPISEIRHRFHHLINLLLEMTGVGVDE